MITVKSHRELEIMREAGRIVALAHAEVKRVLCSGMTTRELDSVVENIIRKAGAIPSFKGYQGFPASSCISINEELVHGIPGDRKIQAGDIVTVDIGAQFKGYHGDGAHTHAVGDVAPEARRLLDVTEASLYEGVKQARVGNRLSDISHAIQVYVELQGMSIVREYVGHGIGQEMHEEPQIANYGPAGKGPRLKAGMVLAIEPMVNLGGPEVRTLLDNWTVVTEDASLCAHFEHSVAITEEGPLLLTVL